MVKDDADLPATAYLQTQKNTTAHLEFMYGPYRPAMFLSLQSGEPGRRDFGDLWIHDTFDPVESNSGRIIEEAENILVLIFRNSFCRNDAPEVLCSES